ncbi:MAG: hypothetical protein M1833_006361 [Piccolia ochrophora]|nr:MAG: hypothetical protein M1833_006361 [Piccolia ochrophora]
MLNPWMTSVLLSLSLCGGPTSAISLPPSPPPDDVLKGEGITSKPNLMLAAAAIAGNAIDRTGWTVTVDSFQPNNEGNKVLDGSDTIWHTQWTPNNAALPHTITVDMKSTFNVNGFIYRPRQDGNSNGNIGRHQVFTSTDGTNFGSPVAFGTYTDDKTEKATSFETKPARYLRIVALTEAGGRGPWTSAAEINVYQASSFTPPPNGIGKWGATINFPIVPVAASIEPTTGKVLTWSSYAADTFSGGPGGKTLTATYDPGSATISQRTVTNTNHDMFCPGISLDANGRPVVTGGNNAARTSIYDPAAANWISAPDMKKPRGYQSSATCSDGRIFTIGGSWSGGEGDKNGEIYSPSANTWTLLTGTPVAPMLTAERIFRSDNHAWLFGWKNGFVFQAGPSKAMNWYGTTGSGSRSAAGPRLADGDAMCGNAVMYDAVNGKILAVNGATLYEGVASTTNAHIITIGNPGSTAGVAKISNTNYARIFANAVVLPNGQVFIAGGQVVGQPFSDNTAALTPEMFTPGANTFTKMLPNTIPRTYHSVALLMIDGTVLVGGGGLCATCSTNHFDAQIFTPPYLLTASGGAATRPVINSVSATNIRIGGTLTVTTNSAVTSMALVRYGSSTHTVNTDQRRIALTPTSTGTNTYTVVVPNDAGIALPGYWMLFVLNSAGVPSVSKTVLIRP